MIFFPASQGGKENIHYFRQCLLRLSVMMNRTGFRGAPPLVGKWDYSVFLQFFCSSLRDELYSQKGWERGGNQKRMWEGRGRQRETSLPDSLNFWWADPCSWSFNYTEMRSVFFAEPPPCNPPELERWLLSVRQEQVKLQLLSGCSLKARDDYHLTGSLPAKL